MTEVRNGNEFIIKSEMLSDDECNNNNDETNFDNIEVTNNMTTISVSPSAFKHENDDLFDDEEDYNEDNNNTSSKELESMYYMECKEIANLEPLPQPVHNISCAHSRKVLVKLLRVANSGNNPMYGNVHTRPPFWPQDYWPWEKLTDVHSKPQGMRMPYQYSVMMKLAISRGYRYYGYDPLTYVVSSDKKKKCSGPEDPNRKRYMYSNTTVPPELNSLNERQTKGYLAKIIGYSNQTDQQQVVRDGEKPVWWPEELLMWLKRNKPESVDNIPYLHVLKIVLTIGLEFHRIRPDHFVSKPFSMCAFEHFQTNEPVRIAESVEQKQEQHQSNKISSSCANSQATLPKLIKPLWSLSNQQVLNAIEVIIHHENGLKKPKYDDIQDMPTWWNLPELWFKLNDVFNSKEDSVKSTVSEEDVINPLRLLIDKCFAHHQLSPNAHVDSSQQLLEDGRYPQLLKTAVAVEKPLPTLIPFDSGVKSNNGDETLKRPMTVINFCQRFWNDRICEGHTDMFLVSADGVQFPAHKCFIASQSKVMSELLEQHESISQGQTTVQMADVNANIMKLMVRILYLGCDEKIVVKSKKSREIDQALTIFKSYGMLEKVELVCDLSSSNDEDNEDTSEPTSVNDNEGAKKNICPTPSKKSKPSNEERHDKNSEFELICRKATLLTQKDVSKQLSWGGGVFISWLAKIGFLVKPFITICPKCLGVVEIVKDETSLDGYSWSCPTHQDDHSSDVRKGSIFEIGKDTPKTTLDVCLRLLVAFQRKRQRSDLPGRIIQRETGLDLPTEEINYWYDMFEKLK